MTARANITTAIKTAKPKWRVFGYPTDVDAVTGTTVIVWQDRVTPHPDAPESHLEVTLAGWLLTGITDPARADDALDDALVDLLGILHSQPWLIFQNAERGVLADRFPGYKFELVAVAAKKED